MAAQTVRLGTASPGTRSSTAATLQHLEQLAQRAAADNIDILLLPEAYIGGYPRGTHFGSVIGERTAEGREEYLRYFRNAVDLGDTVDGGVGGGDAWLNREIGMSGSRPGSSRSGSVQEGAYIPTLTTPIRGDGTREILERIARDTGVFLVVGCIEKAGGSLYCSAVYVEPRRGMIGKRRKVMPTSTERLVWAQGSPATLKAVSTTIRGVRINMAAAICWENYMPLLRQALYAQNVNLYLAPTADGRETWMGLMTSIAVEGRCFVISSNMCVRDGKEQAIENGFMQTALPIRHSNGTRDDDDIAPDDSRSKRRKSCMTEDGHEILLPEFKNSTSVPDIGAENAGSGRNGTTKDDGWDPQRRKSCITEEGFEIALPESQTPDQLEEGKLTSEDAVSDTMTTEDNHVLRGRKNSCLTAEGFEIALPASSGVQTKRRRKSIMIGDGHEIVLATHEEDVVAIKEVPEDNAGDKTPLAAPSLQQNGVNGLGTTNGLQGRKTFISRGGSSIISPFGKVLRGPQWEDDTEILFVDVDFEDCVRGRLDFDAAGSYSRYELAASLNVPKNIPAWGRG
jgi:nitrilase